MLPPPPLVSWESINHESCYGPSFYSGLFTPDKLMSTKDGETRQGQVGRGREESRWRGSGRRDPGREWQEAQTPCPMVFPKGPQREEPEPQGLLGPHLADAAGPDPTQTPSEEGAGGAGGSTRLYAPSLSQGRRPGAPSRRWAMGVRTRVGEPEEWDP